MKLKELAVGDLFILKKNCFTEVFEVVLPDNEGKSFACVVGFIGLDGDLSFAINHDDSSRASMFNSDIEVFKVKLFAKLEE